MGIQFTVYPIARLVGYMVEGDATEAEAGAFLAAVLAHPRYKRGFDFLGECRGAGEPAAACPSALARAVLARAAELGTCRWAVIVPAPEGADAAGRPGQPTAAGAVTLAAFPTRAAAVEWLGGD